ncbi:MAG: hypothetical protein ACRDT6_09075 [Micromonosporaceae bacterium]
MAGYAILLFTGLALGWVAGSRFQKARRGWRDYRVHKTQLPMLRNLALVLTRDAVGFVVLAVVVGVLALYLLATESSH